MSVFTYSVVSLCPVSPHQMLVYCYCVAGDFKDSQGHAC